MIYGVFLGSCNKCVSSLRIAFFTDLHAVEVLGVFHYHAVSQDQQIANVSHLTGVVRGERGGGVAHRSQNSYRTGRRERKEEKRGEETGRVKRKRAGGEEGILQVEEKEGRKEGRKKGRKAGRAEQTKKEEAKAKQPACMRRCGENESDGQP